MAHEASYKDGCNTISKNVLPEGQYLINRGEFEKLEGYFQDKEFRGFTKDELQCLGEAGVIVEMSNRLSKILKQKPALIVLYTIIYCMLRPGGGSDELAAIISIDRILRGSNVLDENLSDIRLICEDLRRDFSALKPGNGLTRSLMRLIDSRLAILKTKTEEAIEERHKYGPPSNLTSPLPCGSSRRPPSSSCQLGGATGELDIPRVSVSGISPTVGSAPQPSLATRKS